LAQLLAKRGVGEGRLEKLLDLMERAEREVRGCGANGSPDPSPPQVKKSLAQTESPWCLEPDHLTEPAWERWRAVIEAHRLGALPLGRFARSLHDLPQGLWDVELRAFSQQKLSDVMTMPGCGSAKVRQVLGVLTDVVRMLCGAPPESHLLVRLFSAHIHGVDCWIEEQLVEGLVPDLASIREYLAEPLLEQLELDLGDEAGSMIRRRWGVDGRPETLDEVGESVGLSRERVRQVTSKAIEVISVRWPEGKHLLHDFYHMLQGAPEAAAELRLVRTIVDGCFSVTFSRNSSRAEVISAWDRAGRNKQTPMTTEELRVWLATEFPELSPEVAHGWLSEDGLLRENEDGQVLYFSRDPLDRLLHHLYSVGQPIHMMDVLDFVEGDERNVRNSLDRDHRFIEDEFKRVLAAEQCSFYRKDGRWYVRLDADPAEIIKRRADAIAISDLIHMIVGGLVQAGICDATVWGVHRFACLLLRRVYGATLPASVTPFILASTLTRHSNGLVRPMRRRRLRWDSADSSVPVRGKRGWVDHLATKVGTPMTLDELDTVLRGCFQDYESYVLQQLNLDEEEEGERSYGCRLVPGVTNRIPGILIPRGWELDLARQNVSEGIRFLVAKIVAASTRSAYPKSHLRRVPWLVDLCEHAAFGEMRWEERSAAPEDETLEEDAILELANPPPPEGEGQATKADESAAVVEDLLSQFL